MVYTPPARPFEASVVTMLNHSQFTIDFENARAVLIAVTKRTAV